MNDIFSVALRPWLERDERLTMSELLHRGFSCFLPTEDVEQPQILKYEENHFFYTQALGGNFKQTNKQKKNQAPQLAFTYKPHLQINAFAYRKFHE